MSKVEELIARVRELDAAATPGPWGGFDATRGNPVDGPTRIDIRDTQGEMVACIEDFSAPAGRDASLIAEYRTLAPKLADMLRKAMAALGAAEVDALQGLPWDSSAYLRVFREIEAIAEGSEA